MIYICIPTHNEQQTVGVVLWKLRQVLTDFPREYQLLVADDASTDKTHEVLEPYTRVLPLTVIRSEARQGTAASLEMLLREAVRRSEYPKRDVIVTLQADFSDEPDDLVPLAKRLEAGADVAVGNKVSVSKETRARRFARSLAGFFMRRQKWPEGVVTPFEGFRAYRLYAIKRAIEERAGSRLLRYDGWAGNAELLRAVLPHARRVDVVDVDDRPDRLQRPRREKPFAAAMQVRVMAAGTEPAGLTGVEELDRIARTASRSRERAAITPQSIQAGRSGQARGNGSRQRAGQSQRRDQSSSQRRDEGSTRTEVNGTGAGAETTGESRPGRTRQASGERTRSSAERTRPKSDAGTGRSRSKQGEAKRRQPKPAAADADAAAVAEEPTLPADANADGVQAPDATPRPKRKRRRRKRSGQAGTAVAGQQDPASQDLASQSVESRGSAESPGPAASRDAPGEGADGRDIASPDEPGADGTVEKKRRRRGGRRGGRGRRKPQPEGAGDTTSDTGAPGAESSSAGSATLPGADSSSAGSAQTSAAQTASAAPAPEAPSASAPAPATQSADTPAARPEND